MISDISGLSVLFVGAISMHLVHCINLHRFIE